MGSVFTRIIDGDLPGRIVWADDLVVGFLSINPLGPGHTLVVPRAEVDHWIDADQQLLIRLTDVARTIGRAIEKVWTPPRVGMMIAGFEVPHLHVHVFPTWNLEAFDFANAAESVDGDEEDQHAEALRGALLAAGHRAHVVLSR